jgi:hypothetical protein
MSSFYLAPEGKFLNFVLFKQSENFPRDKFHKNGFHENLGY